MRKTSKTVIVSLVSLLTFTFGATPALAHDTGLASAYSAEMNDVASLTGQSLQTEIDPNATVPIDAMLTSASEKTGPNHSFDVDAAIELATLEIGTSRATGWAQPGECIMSANRWIKAGGGNWQTGGSPVTNYANATRLPLELAERGDIIQYEHLAAPHAWLSGIHTVLVTGVNPDGTLSIIESNNPGGSGLVSENLSWVPAPPAGSQAVVWRF